MVMCILVFWSFQALWRVPPFAIHQCHRYVFCQIISQKSYSSHCKTPPALPIKKTFHIKHVESHPLSTTYLSKGITLSAEPSFHTIAMGCSRFDRMMLGYLVQLWDSRIGFWILMMLRKNPIIPIVKHKWNKVVLTTTTHFPNLKLFCQKGKKTPLEKTSCLENDVLNFAKKTRGGDLQLSFLTFGGWSIKNYTRIK